MVETATEEKVPLEAKNKPFMVCGFLGVFWNLSYGSEDHLGSTRMVLDENGYVKQALMYQPYGTVSDVAAMGATATDPLRQKFTTKEFDEEGDANSAPGIKAYHFGFRVYDPDIGVWMSTDPADQYWNTYSYCGGDPVNLIDPDGAYVPWGVITSLAGAATGFYLGGVAGNGGQLNPAKWDNWGAAGAGMLVGTAIGAGIGWGIESGAFSILGTAMRYDIPLSVASTIYNISYGGYSVANSTTQLTINKFDFQLPNGVDGITKADDRITLLEKVMLESYENFDPLDYMGAGGVKIIGAANKAAKGAKILKVISKVWPKHHPFPKYLGGAVNQTLKKIPKNLHHKFHSALDKFKGGKYARSKGSTSVPKEEIIEDLREFYKKAEGGIFKKYLPDLERAILESQ